jgi:hypothetical protein
MAQVIRTLCDVHLEQNEEVDATTLGGACASGWLPRPGA